MENNREKPKYLFHCDSGKTYACTTEMCLVCGKCEDIWWDFSHGPYLFFCSESHDTSDGGIGCEHFILDTESENVEVYTDNPDLETRVKNFMRKLYNYIWHYEYFDKYFDKKDYHSIELNEELFDKVSEEINKDKELKKKIKKLKIRFIKVKEDA